MPNGRYTVLDGSGGLVGHESFRSARGPLGWRYLGEIDDEADPAHRETVDLAVDGGWRIVRLSVDTGEHRLLLEPRGGVLAGLLDGHDVEIPYGPDDHLDYFTPATNAASCGRLGATAEIDVVYLAPRTLEVSRQRQRYERHDEEQVDTPVGTFRATRWTFTALDSGWSADLWIADATVVRYDRLFTLEWYAPGASGPTPMP
jgi:hypothetical protein